MCCIWKPQICFMTTTEDVHVCAADITFSYNYAVRPFSCWPRSLLRTENSCMHACIIILKRFVMCMIGGFNLTPSHELWT